MADPAIAELLASIDADDDSKMVSVIEDVLARLEVQKLAWRARIPPRAVGVHKENRGGYGVGAPEVHRLGADITKMGWSHAATSHAVCVEDVDGSTAKFTHKLASQSPGLPVVPASEIRYGSLSCSHTNQFLVAALCGVPTEQQSLAVGGKMSADMLGSRDASMKEALTDGLLWLVVSHKATVLYPSLCEHVQAARNSSGAAHHKEDSFQIMLKAHTMAASMSKAGNGVVDWDKVLKVIMRRCHASEQEVKPVLKYIQRYGGGDCGVFAAELDEFKKMFVPAGRIVPATTFQALADLKLTATELSPHFMAAVVKLQAACPRDKVCPNKVCRYVTASEINSLAGPRKQHMIAAEKVLMECRAIAKQHDVSGPVVAQCFGRLDKFMATLVLGKKDDKFSTVEEVGKQFVKDLLGAGTKIACPWSAESSDAASSAAPAGQVPNFVQYTSEGSPIAPEQLSLKSSGFKVGATVRKSDGPLCEIVEFGSDGDVTVRNLSDTAETMTIDYQTFTSQFRLTSATIEVMSTWQDRAPAKQSVYAEARNKAYVLSALAHLGSTSTTELKIQLKPTRGVFADCNFANGKLCVVPETLKMVTSPASAQNGLECVITLSGIKSSVWLLPSFSETFASPAWAVRSVSDTSEANVAVSKKTVAIDVGGCKVSVQVPVLTNTKKIRSGDELLIYKEPSVKAAKRHLLTLHGAGNAKSKRVS